MGAGVFIFLSFVLFFIPLLDAAEDGFPEFNITAPYLVHTYGPTWPSQDSLVFRCKVLGDHADCQPVYIPWNIRFVQIDVALTYDGSKIVPGSEKILYATEYTGDSAWKMFRADVSEKSEWLTSMVGGFVLENFRNILFWTATTVAVLFVLVVAVSPGDEKGKPAPIPDITPVPQEPKQEIPLFNGVPRGDLVDHPEQESAAREQPITAQMAIAAALGAIRRPPPPRNVSLLSPAPLQDPR